MKKAVRAQAFTVFLRIPPYGIRSRQMHKAVCGCYMAGVRSETTKMYISAGIRMFL
jgi:hypothetical protein